MSTDTKSPGQLAYEEDVRRCPNYHDGAPRISWNQLYDHEKASWHKDATPRDFKHLSKNSEAAT
jgi:hypothetical protein